MALIAVASDKGAPGVTTTALALASVWPEPVLLAECDPAGGDLVFRFPAADGRQLDPRRGLLSLAVSGRRDYQQQQVWQHAQKIHGGLDVLVGVTNAEQGAGLGTLWGPLGTMLASLPDADVIADCGRLGPDGPFYDLLAGADAVLLVTRAELGDIIRLRDRAAVVVAEVARRGRSGFAVDVLTIADAQRLKTAEAEVTHALAQAGVPVRLSCGLADDRKGAELLRGTWGGKLDKSLLIRTAREAAGQLAASRPPVPAGTQAPRPSAPAGIQQAPGLAQPAPGQQQAPGQRQPPYGQPSPGYDQPSPGYDQPSPGYDQASQGYGQRSPDYGQPSPDYGQPSQGYGEPLPNRGQPDARPVPAAPAALAPAAPAAASSQPPYPAGPVPPPGLVPPPGPVPTFHPRHAGPGSPVNQPPERQPPERQPLERQPAEHEPPERQRPARYAPAPQPDGYRGR